MSRDLWLRELGIDLLAEPGRLTSALLHELSSPFEIAPHHHAAELQLDLIEGCSGSVFHNGRWLRFAGDLVLVSYPGRTHGYHLEPVENVVERSRVFNFKLRVRPNWGLIEQHALPFIARPDSGERRLYDIAGAIVRTLGEPTNPRVSALVHTLALLDGWPTRSAPTDLTEPETSEADPDVEAAVTLIEERLHAPPSLAELAARVGVSARHLARLFRAATGMTPHRYATIRRVDRARLLLLRRGTPIADIAEDLGFASHATFTRWFREHTGETPQSFRTNPSVF